MLHDKTFIVSQKDGINLYCKLTNMPDLNGYKIAFYVIREMNDGLENLTIQLGDFVLTEDELVNLRAALTP